jgi:hypothetical protein
MKEEGRRKKEEGGGLQDMDSDPNSKRATCRGRGIKPPTQRIIFIHKA